MYKFYIPTFIGLIAIIGLIFYATQTNSHTNNSSLNAVPTLPADANTFKPITPAQQQAQQQAQQNQTQNPASVNEPVPASVSATIKTSKGNIVLTLYGQDAPNTVRNFINKAKSGFYNNLTFHRVEDWVIQGGDPKGDGTGGGQMRTELNQKPFVTGSLGVARGGDINISNDAQFFITKSDASWLNGQYTNFGIVTDGMDVVNKIQIGDKILGITIE